MSRKLLQCMCVCVLIDFHEIANDLLKFSPILQYLDRRCLTAETCKRIGKKYEIDKSEFLVPYDGRCSTRCPEGYDKSENTCVKCKEKCVKNCIGGHIDSVARAKAFRGCTNIVEQGLTIIMKRGGSKEYTHEIIIPE